MRFIQFVKDGEQYLGLELQEGGDILNLNLLDGTIPRDLKTFIECGKDKLIQVERISNQNEHVLRRNSVKLLPPLTSCEKVLCIGMNYKDHCKEQNTSIPEEPIIFNKFPNCIIGPDDDLHYPKETKFLDYEAELVIVVGKHAKNVQVKDAMEYVFGFTAANDFCARDWVMKNGGQVVLSSAMDETCPLGPSVVTVDELDPHNLGIKCRVNGVLKQDSTTELLIHKTEQILAYITRFMTLKPGDLILTGSPPGVGHCRNPPEYLKIGDIVEVEIEKIGKIKTTLV